MENANDENIDGGESSSQDSISGKEQLVAAEVEETPESFSASPVSRRAETTWRPPMASRVALVAVILLGLLALYVWIQATFPTLLLRPGGCSDACVRANPGDHCPTPCEDAKEAEKTQALTSRDTLLPFAVGLSVMFVIALVAFDRLRYGQKK